MAGNGLAGIGVVVARIITKATLPDTDSGATTSAIIYFSMGCATLILCIFAYMVLLRLPFTQYHVAAARTPVKQTPDTFGALGDAATPVPSDDSGSDVEAAEHSGAGRSFLKRPLFESPSALSFRTFMKDTLHKSKESNRKLSESTSSLQLSP